MFIQSDRGFGDVALHRIDQRCYKNLHTGQIICESEQKPGNDQEPESVQEKVQPVLSWEERPEGAFWVSERLTEDILLVNQSPRFCLGVRAAEKCLYESPDKSSCYSSTPIELAACESQSNQVWRHDLLTKRIFNRAAGYRYCLTRYPEGFSLLPCFPGGSPSQRWYFARGKSASSPEIGQLRTMLNGILDPHSYTRALTLPVTVNEPKKKKPGALAACRT
ncbi:RICIN domain-containing protein [Endozoicomonas sp. ISHI1]|uniref:RICIN domain-containing protein n=1 Tax=Endozoicomonas sp. ISHI1 TaxID=2825882 RepID=UPI002147FEA3|nr:RICIN domain-containing protein [Endozoicomonas sp. ISHI1]